MPRLTGFAPSTIPGPSALPFIGTHINTLRLLMDPLRWLTDLHQNYGNVATVAAGSPAMVLAFGSILNREVLSNPALFDNEGRFFLSAPEGTPVALFGLGMPFVVGETHRRHRKLLIPAFQKSVIEGYAPEIVRITEHHLEQWPVGTEADVALLIRKLVQEVVIGVLFGLGADEDDGGLGDAATEMVDLVTDPWVLLPLNVSRTPYARLQSRSRLIFEQLRRLLRKKREQSERGHDALALIVDARDADGGTLSEEELLGEAATLYVAGHDTQAKTLAWTLWLLEQHPFVLADLVEELHKNLGSATPGYADIARLPLLDRVVKESMRLLPTVPMLFHRVVASDTTLGGHPLPAGANVILSPWITHRDPTLYPDPDRFLPSRWETIKPTPYEYMPFGGGHRSCLGAAFATLSLRLMLALILRRYRLSLKPGANISRRVRGNILAPRYGIPMHIHTQDRQFKRCADLSGDMLEFVRMEGV